MRLGAALLLSAATLLPACAEQAGGYAPTNVTGPYYPYGYSAPASGYEPGYYGQGYYSPGVIIGGGDFWGNGYDQDRSWYHRDRAWYGDRAWQEQEFLRHQNEAQSQAQATLQRQQQRAQASLQLQQQKAQALAAQAQASLQLQQRQAQAALQLQQQKAAQVQAWQQQQRVQALAAQNQAILHQRAAMQAAQQTMPR